MWECSSGVIVCSALTEWCWTGQLSSVMESVKILNSYGNKCPRCVSKSVSVVKSRAAEESPLVVGSGPFILDDDSQGCGGV